MNIKETEHNAVMGNHQASATSFIRLFIYLVHLFGPFCSNVLCEREKADVPSAVIQHSHATALQ